MYSQAKPVNRIARVLVDVAPSRESMTDSTFGGQGSPVMIPDHCPDGPEDGAPLVFDVGEFVAT